MSIKVKDADGVDKYYETIEEGTISKPFQSVIPDFKIASAINEINNVYGDTVSVWNKAKSLIKFGTNPDLDNGVAEMIWETGGIETIATGNDIDIVVSTDVGDTQNIVIEGHTISGSDLTFVSQTATLNGTTNVTLSTPLARVSRLYNDDSVDFLGNITVEDNGTSVNLTVLGTNGENQSKKCATSLSSVDYWIITEFSGGVIGSVSATVEFKLQTKKIGKVWRTIYEFNSDSYTDVQLNPCIIIPPNTDVRVIGESNTNNTEAVSNIRGYLALIQ